ncbi:MAG: helix-turn-helix transcriptional regulator [Bacteroidota bacterium]|nr:helix-turn-helix transcriptional regulator [Bacteroidota bacterium]
MQNIFSQQLAKAIKAMKYSQVEFASKLGIDKSKMSRLVNGNSEPELELLQKMKHIFDLNLNWLICGSGQMKDSYTEKNIINEPKAHYFAASDVEPLKKTIAVQEKLISIQEKNIERLESELKSLRKE